MNNPWEVDVSKEDIAITDETSDAEAEFFGVHTNTGSNKSAFSTKEEERMPAARTRRTSKVVEEEAVSGENLVTMIVHTPRHLWGLGATQFHFSVSTTDEAFEALGKMQENFEWMEDAFADRLADVAALENRISLAQQELLNTLAEETGEDLPDDLTDYSKTEASKLIRELMSQRESKPQRTSSRRGVRVGSSRGAGRSSTRSRPSARPKRRTGGGRGGRRTGGGRRQFSNDAPGSATEKMQDFLVDLCRQANVEAPTDDEFGTLTFNEVSAEITELRKALGYEDN